MENIARELFLDKFLFCCLTPGQREELQAAMETKQYVAVYRCQENILKEKDGYRCKVCGKFYPFLEIHHRGETLDPRTLSKIKGRQQKWKKAAAVFRGTHYYAHQKKSLLKFEPDAQGNMRQTGEIPLMGDVCHTILSRDERFAATETFGGTLAVLDAGTGQTIARKRKCKLNGSFLFAEENTLLYYWQDAIRCWVFGKNREEILWGVPEEWKQSGARVTCRNVLYNPAERACLFLLGAGEAAWVVRIRENVSETVARLPYVPVHSELVYAEALRQYTLVFGDQIHIFDENFQLLEQLACPKLTRISDGGGVFPVTRMDGLAPHRAFLSPDGKWLLVDYFNYVVLLKHEDLSLKFCLFSYTGKAALRMGFIDSVHFWYTWGDTTYIQEIGE